MSAIIGAVFVVTFLSGLFAFLGHVWTKLRQRRSR